MPVDFAAVASKFGGEVETTPPASGFADFAKAHGGEVETQSPTPKAGLLTPGTLDPFKRPTLKFPEDDDGSTSSVSFDRDGKEILIPTTFEDQPGSGARRHTLQESIAHYDKTGEHLGIFASPEAADTYATALDTEQQRRSAASSPRRSTTWQEQRAAAHPAGSVSPFAQQAADVLATPIRGVQQVVKGARDLATSLITPPVPPPTSSAAADGSAPDALAMSGEMQPTQLSTATKDALSDLVEGTFKATSPMIGAGLVAAPVRTLIAIGAATGANQAAQDAVKALGGDEASQRLAGNVAAALAAGHGTDYVLRTFKGDIDALAARGREANNRPAPEAARVTPEATDIEVQPRRPVSAQIPATAAGDRPITPEGTPVTPSPSPAPEGATFADVATAHGGVVETAAPVESVDAGAPSPAPGRSQAPPAPADVQTAARAALDQINKQAAENATAGLGKPGDVPNTPEAQELERQRQEATAGATPKLALKVGDNVKPVASMEEAAHLYDTLRAGFADAQGPGSSDLVPEAHIVNADTLKPVARISDNGRIWDAETGKEIERADGRGYGKEPAITVAPTPPAKKPVTPQLPPAGGGDAYVLPSFATAGAAKGKAAEPITIYRGRQVGQTDGGATWWSASKPLAEHFAGSVRGKGKAAGEVVEGSVPPARVLDLGWLVTGYKTPRELAAKIGVPVEQLGFQHHNDETRVHHMLEQPAVQAAIQAAGYTHVGATEKGTDKQPVATYLQLPTAQAAHAALPEVDSTPAWSEVAQAHGGEAEAAQVADGTEVAQNAADEGSTVSSDRGPLAGVPAEDGRGARGEGHAGELDRASGGGDVGGGESGDTERTPGPPSAGDVSDGVGVPSERGRSAGRPDPTDFRLTAADAEVVASGGPKQRIAQNLDAIDTLKTIEAENRLASPAEQAVMAKYVGWGGLSNAFNPKHKDFSPELKALLTTAEYDAARASTPNAHYTALPVIHAVYEGLERLGLRGPIRFLEPAAGVGHFLGMMPAELAARASRQAVEMDAISGRITAALYPHAQVHVAPFQQAALPNDHFDLIVSNVPFGNYQVSDPGFAGRPKALTSSIHNYYFAKAFDLVRPGGIVAFITSRYTMDAADSAVRSYLHDRGVLLGAIRLPNTAFKANAGTEVVTDIIFLQRNGESNPVLKSPLVRYGWLSTTPMKVGDKSFPVNDFFHRNPEMVLGKPAASGSMYGSDEYTVEPTGDLPAQLAAAMARLPTNAYTPPTTKAATPTLEQQLPSASVPPNVRQNAWFEGKDGHLYIRQGDVGVKVDLSKDQAVHVKSLLRVRDGLRTTIETMLAPDASDADVKTAQKALEKHYDAFVKKYGYLAKRQNYRALREDPDVYALQALEEWKPKADKPEKAAIFKTRTLRPHTPVTSVGTPKEAMLVSLNETGGIDWPRMSALTGQSVHDLQDALDGLVFHDPGSDTWEQSDRYLSGNVKAKLAAAKEAAAKEAKYAANVAALEKVQPADLDPTDIAIRLGAPWVPGQVLDNFATHLGLPGLTFRYSPSLAKWSVNEHRFNGYNAVQNTAQWGTLRKPGHILLATVLNLGDPVVYDTVGSGDAVKRVVNQAETIAARDKVEALQEEFRAWAWAETKRATRLARIYNDTMNTMRLWEPDGSHLTLPGLSSAITLRPHQKNFIWRGLQQPNTLAHHVVGAGKTLAAIGLALEKRRLGLARKPLITVPNHLPQQWGREIQRAYPAARVLVSSKADFEPGNRKRFLNRIATGDWDAVVMPMSHFGMIRVNDETFNAHLSREIAGYAAELTRAREEAGKNDPSVKELEKAKMNLEAKIRTAKDRQAKDSDVPTFEKLGLDMLIVDEAHNYKKLGFPTKMTRVAGVPAGPGSQRALDLKIKSGYISQANPTGGTVFLTGTPISNTMAEMFVLLRYLAQPMLNQRGMPQFDGWAATFGQLVTAFEISPTGRGFRQKTRFAKFTNLPELVQMYRSFADVQTADMLKLPTPPLKGGKAHVTTVPASAALDEYVDELLERFAAVLGQRGQKPDPRVDNPLKITTDGRKAALDLRLVGLEQPEGGKVDQAAESIKRKYDEFAKQKGTQLVFADLGAPNAEKEKAGEFTVYGALRDKLIALGIPREHIAFIQEANTDARKQALFDAMNAGDIRVLVGSSETMGAGMNVQQRLVKLHHLDAPWRPADIEQREGRILRQGNLLADKGSPLYDPKFEVEIATYVTARSFDAYLWQLLENKARFITQALKGDITARETDDADDVVLNFAQAKGAASGNPAIMEHAKTQSDLQRLEASEANHDRRKWRLQRELASLPEQIAHTEALQANAAALVKAITIPEKRTITIGGQALHGQEASEAIQAGFERSRNGKRAVTDNYHSQTHPVVIGHAAGVEVRGYILTSTVFDPPTIQPKWIIGAGDAVMEKNAATGAGALQSLYVFLENGPRNALAQHTEELATLRSSLEAAKSEAAKGFPHKEKVTALRARLKALEQELNLDKDAQAKEAAAAGAIVTSAEEDKADLAAEQQAEAEPAVPDASEPPAPKRGGGGTTLQSAVIPGLKEFAEGDVGPALKQAAGAVQEARTGLRTLFAPDTVSRTAGVMAGLTRANLAIQWQRLQRARVAMGAAAKAMDRLYKGAETGDQAAREKFLTFTDAMEGGDLTGLSPDERAVAAWAREALDLKRGEVQSFGKLEDYLENYFPHEWAQPSKAKDILRRLFGKKPIEGSKAFLKQRSIPTVRAGVEAGLEPVSWNPVTLVQRKLHEMEKWLTVRRILEQGKETGVAKFVRSGKPAPEGWVRYSEPIGTVYGPRTEIGPTIAGHYYGPKDAVRILERYLSPGLRGNSVIYDLFRSAGNFLNQVQLSLSVFHVMTTGLESMISKQALALERLSRGDFGQAARAQAQVPIAPILDLIRGHRGLKAFYTDDATTHQVNDIIGQVVQAGGGFGWSLFEHTGAPQRFMQAIRAGNYPGAALRTLPALIEMTAWPVMEWWVPRLKMAAFLDRAAMELETLGPNPDLTEARRVLGEAWDSIDNRFGQLRYDNLFWHNTLKDLSMASVRAVGWNVGSLREMFGAPGAQMKRLGLVPGGGSRPTRTVNTGKKGRQEQYEQRPEPALHPKMAWLASMVFIAGLIGALYHWMHTGNQPTELKDYYFPKNGKKNPDGTDQRVSLPGYFKDLFAWSTHPLVTAEHKVNPLLETLVEMLENEDYYGVEIRNSGDPLVQQAKDVAGYLAGKYQPISASRFGEDASAENFLGVNRAPADLTRTPAEAKMRDIAQRRGYPSLTKEQALERDARRQIRSDVASRTPEGREAAREVARSGVLSPRQVALARTSSTRTALQRQFQPLTAPEGLDVYEVATPEERRILWPLLRAKVARSSLPVAEQRAVRDRLKAAVSLPRATAEAVRR